MYEAKVTYVINTLRDSFPGDWSVVEQLGPFDHCIYDDRDYITFARNGVHILHFDGDKVRWVPDHGKLFGPWYAIDFSDDDGLRKLLRVLCYGR